MTVHCGLEEVKFATYKYASIYPPQRMFLLTFSLKILPSSLTILTSAIVEVTNNLRKRPCFLLCSSDLLFPSIETGA